MHASIHYNVITMGIFVLFACSTYFFMYSCCCQYNDVTYFFTSNFGLLVLWHILLSLVFLKKFAMFY